MKVLVLDDYIGVAQASADWKMLPAGSELTIIDRWLPTDVERAEVLRPYQVIVAMRERTPFPAALIEALPNLRLLVTTGGRNASIDIGACNRRGVVVCSAPGDPIGSAPAELTWALILGLLKRVALEHSAMQSGQWQTVPTQRVAGKRLGLVGLGKLGTAVAKVGLAFGMRAQAWSPHLTAQRAEQVGVAMVDKATLFSSSDVVSLHLVLGPGTDAIVTRADLRSMKSTAFFVNTSRAGLVESGALEEAVASGWIAGAGLDVYPVEPVPADDPIRRLDNVVLSPHLGYVTPENMQAFYGNALAAILAWQGGAPIRVLEADGA